MLAGTRRAEMGLLGESKGLVDCVGVWWWRELLGGVGRGASVQEVRVRGSVEPVHVATTPGTRQNGCDAM